MPYKHDIGITQISNESQILQYIFLKHQYLIINEYLFMKVFRGIKRKINTDFLTLTENKIYSVVKELSNVLYRVEDFMKLNNELEYENPIELEALLQEQLLNPEYYTIQTLKEGKDEVSKDDIRDLKRFSFKNFQDILERIEAKNSNEELVKEMEKTTRDLHEKMAKGAVEIFNLIFDIGTSLEESPDSTLTPIIQISIEKSKQILKDLGIEEIPTYGKEIDGKYMFSLGTVKNKEDTSIPRDHVAIVHKKAFKITDTNKVIQEAVVQTIE